MLLLRHGKTASNETNRYCGRTDEPLSSAGFAEAYACGINSAALRVYVSPMLRAVQTAQICFSNATQIPVYDFREMDFGDFEGRTADEMVNDAAYRAWVDAGCLTECPNGEAMYGFSVRVCNAFDALVKNAIEQKENRIVMVAHGGTIMVIMNRYAYPKRSYYYDWYVRNCCGYQTRLNATTWQSFPRLIGCKAIPEVPHFPR